MKRSVMSIAVVMAIASGGVAAKDVAIHAIDTNGIGKRIGTVSVEDSAEGLVLTADLEGLSEGAHGFHVHENASCAPKEKDGKLVAGLAAGGHFDPHKSGKHEGPAGQGHLGDLPALVAEKDGTAKTRHVARRLKVADLRGRSFIIHEGGDNYADSPKPLGGGGGRIACGIID